MSEINLRETLSMVTYTGRVISIRDPKSEDIELEDIAQGLSMQCRYAGQISRFYSVAEHSIHCSTEAANRGDYRLQLACLLHDAAEAYVGDLIWPVKQALRGESAPRFDRAPSMFDRIEERFALAIARRFGLEPYFDEAPEVKAIDQAVCAREQMTLRTMPAGWKPHVEPASVRIDPHAFQHQPDMDDIYAVKSDFIDAVKALVSIINETPSSEP